MHDDQVVVAIVTEYFIVVYLYQAANEPSLLSS